MPSAAPGCCRLPWTKKLTLELDQDVPESAWSGFKHDRSMYGLCNWLSFFCGLSGFQGWCQTIRRRMQVHLISQTVYTRRPRVSPSIDFIDKSTPRAPSLANRLDGTNPSVTLHQSLHRSHHHTSSHLANCQDETNASVPRRRS